MNRLVSSAGIALALSLASCQSAIVPARLSPGSRPTVDSLESLSAYPDGHRGSWEFGVVGMVGGRGLSGSTFGEVDEHGVFGVEFDARPRDSILGVEAGIAATSGYEDDVQGTRFDLEASTSEAYVGPRLTFELTEIFRIYTAAGISAVYADIESYNGTTVVDDDDSSVAGYVHGGFYFHAGPVMRLGLDVRYLYGSDIDVFNRSGDADALQVAFLVGARF